MIKVAILTVSDSCFKGKRLDESGKAIQDLLDKKLFEAVQYEVVPDETEMIRQKLLHYAEELRVDLILTCGGTGFGPRDVTADVTREICKRLAPGIPELMRSEGLKKAKNAMLSRSVSGIRNNSLIINLPGSPEGAKESLTAILDILPHAIDMLKDKGH